MVLFVQALRDAEKASMAVRPSNDTKTDNNGVEDSEEEGEELLKHVKDRKASVAKRNMSPQERDLLHRLSSVEEGN